MLMSRKDEIDRLNQQHELFQFVFDNRLIFPPLRNPRRILECGYGTAAWAVEVAEQYPDCEVSISSWGSKCAVKSAT